MPIVLETRTYSQPRFGEYKDDDTSVTLRAMGADYGGGSEVIVVSYQKVTGPLMANSHPGSYCGQDAYSDMLIVGGNNGNDLYGNGTRPGFTMGIIRTVESAGFKELNSAKARSDAYEHEKAPCLSANKHDACVCIKTEDTCNQGGVSNIEHES